MTNEDFEDYLRGLGYAVEDLVDSTGISYVVIRQVEINGGSLAGKTCDVAFARVVVTPFVFPPALHVRPQLLPMNTAAPFATQSSVLGSDWQYWSRQYNRPPTVRGVWAHVLTVLQEM